jgi:hypothetical protein
MFSCQKFRYYNRIYSFSLLSVSVFYLIVPYPPGLPYHPLTCLSIPILLTPIQGVPPYAASSPTSRPQGCRTLSLCCTPLLFLFPLLSSAFLLYPPWISPSYALKPNPYPGITVSTFYYSFSNKPPKGCSLIS